MKETQKLACSCAICGKKRSNMEAQLEQLYNTYYEELEQVAFSERPHSLRNPKKLPPLVNDSDVEDIEGMYDDIDEDEDVSDDSDDDIIEFGTSLTVKGTLD
jgi:hypothetical protein